MNPFLHREPLGDGPVRPVSDQQQPGWHLLVHAVENLDDVGDALDGSEVRKMHQHALVVRRILPPHLGGNLRIADVDIAIHRVVDHLNWFLYVEHSLGPVAQVIRNRGNPVALFDRIPGNRKIGAVQTNKGDVGPVQSGHKGQPFLLRAIGEHLPGQHRTHRMRNRIVHMQQVQIVKLCNLRHASGQGQVIRRIVEQRIPRNLDFVIMDIRFRAPEADGLRIRNEVDFVAALRQFQAEFGGHNTTAAIRRITSDPNFHVRKFALAAGFSFDGCGEP